MTGCATAVVYQRHEKLVRNSRIGLNPATNLMSLGLEGGRFLTQRLPLAGLTRSGLSDPGHPGSTIDLRVAKWSMTEFLGEGRLAEVFVKLADSMRSLDGSIPMLTYG